MSGTARTATVRSEILAIAVLTALLGACATPTDRDLLYAKEPALCQHGGTLTCIEKIGQVTTCSCTSEEGLREIFDLGGKY